MKRLWFLLLFLAGINASFGQAGDILGSLLEGLTEMEESEYNMLIEDLEDMMENPLSLADISRDRLRALPFLTDIQIDALLGYKDSTAASLSWEKILISISASPMQREILPKLIFLKDSQQQYHNYNKPVRYNFMTTWWRNIERAEGYKGMEDGAGFEGPAYGLRSRAQVSGRDFSIKVLAESDPGEKDFRMPDHRSAGIELSPGKRLVKILFGDYHFTMGQGLGMGTRPVFSSWKSDPHLQLRKTTGFSLHGSSDENRFLRGGAFQFNKNDLTGRIFISSRDLDATIKELEPGLNYFSGIYSTGLHRTKSELLKKDAVYEEISGVELDYSGNRIEIGALFAGFSYSEKFKVPDAGSWPVDEPDFRNTAFRYSAWGRGLLGRGMLVGEFAMTSTGGSAICAAYSGFYNKGLGYVIHFESNEESFFSRNTSVSSSVVKADGQSKGRINVLYQPRKNWGIQAEMGISGIVDPVLEDGGADIYLNSRLFYELDPVLAEAVFQSKSGKILWTFKIKENDAEKAFYWQGEIGFSSADFQGMIKNPGTYFSARCRYNDPGEHVSLQAGLSLFTGNDNSHPFYIYEPDVYYGMSLPALSGTGSRTFFLLRYKFLKTFSIEIKLSRVDYDDRDEIGSGLDRIPFNHRTSLKVQVVYRGNYEL